MEASNPRRFVNNEKTLAACLGWVSLACDVSFARERGSPEGECLARQYS